MDAHGRLFNRIAGAYQWFFRRQKRYYREKLESILEILHLPTHAKILDLGCGTGAFGSAFQELGFNVIGVDIAPKMVQKGIQNQLNCLVGDVLADLPFPDHTFDLVISAFMLHGLSSGSRFLTFQEAKRLTKNPILFYDYTSPNKATHRGIRLIEKMEGGDYLGFIQTGLDEIRAFFPIVNKYEVNANISFYLVKSS
jgi:ubiquinone/menaquinone biosynthesis C-methylase UbiE